MEIFSDAESLAKGAASWIATESRAAVAARGKFIVAFSGGRTPWRMLHALAFENVPWGHVHIMQVDERVALANDPARNFYHLRDSLGAASLPDENIHAMDVEAADLEAAARQYASTLCEIAGTPPVLDLVHLGLGSDGHTASLPPGDPILDVRDRDVGLIEMYKGNRRMTLTLPILNRSRRILWLVSGDDKAEILARLRHGDTALPAGKIRRENALVFTDIQQS